MNQRCFQRWRWRLMDLNNRRGIRREVSQTGRSAWGVLRIAFLLGACCIHCLPRLPRLARCARLGCRRGVAARRSSGDSSRSRVCSRAWPGRWSELRRRATAGDLPPALEGQDLLVRRLRRIASARRGRRFAIPARCRRAARRRARRGFGSSGIAACDAQPQAGELWQLVVRLKRRNGFANPGGVDHEAQLFREGIGATGYVRDDERNARLAPRVSALRSDACARLDLRSHSRSSARPADARRSAGSRSRRHAGDDARSNGACSRQQARRT